VQQLYTRSCEQAFTTAFDEVDTLLKRGDTQGARAVFCALDSVKYYIMENRGRILDDDPAQTRQRLLQSGLAGPEGPYIPLLTQLFCLGTSLPFKAPEGLTLLPTGAVEERYFGYVSLLGIQTVADGYRLWKAWRKASAANPGASLDPSVLSFLEANSAEGFCVQMCKEITTALAYVGHLRDKAYSPSMLITAVSESAVLFAGFGAWINPAKAMLSILDANKFEPSRCNDYLRPLMPSVFCLAQPLDFSEDVDAMLRIVTDTGGMVWSDEVASQILKKQYSVPESCSGEYQDNSGGHTAILKGWIDSYEPGGEDPGASKPVGGSVFRGRTPVLPTPGMPRTPLSEWPSPSSAGTSHGPDSLPPARTTSVQPLSHETGEPVLLADKIYHFLSLRHTFLEYLGLSAADSDDEDAGDGGKDLRRRPRKIPSSFVDICEWGRSSLALDQTSVMLILYAFLFDDSISSLARFISRLVAALLSGYETALSNGFDPAQAGLAPPAMPGLNQRFVQFVCPLPFAKVIYSFTKSVFWPLVCKNLGESTRSGNLSNVRGMLVQVLEALEQPVLLFNLHGHPLNSLYASLGQGWDQHGQQSRGPTESVSQVLGAAIDGLVVKYTQFLPGLIGHAGKDDVFQQTRPVVGQLKKVVSLLSSCQEKGLEDVVMRCVDRIENELAGAI